MSEWRVAGIIQWVVTLNRGLSSEQLVGATTKKHNRVIPCRRGGSRGARAVRGARGDVWRPPSGTVRSSPRVSTS